VRLGELIAPNLKSGDWVTLEEDGIELTLRNPKSKPSIEFNRRT